MAPQLFKNTPAYLHHTPINSKKDRNHIENQHALTINKQQTKITLAQQNNATMQKWKQNITQKAEKRNNRQLIIQGFKDRDKHYKELQIKNAINDSHSPNDNKNNERSSKAM